MSLFKQKSPANRCGAIVDVGSGSVGVAIVVLNSESGKLHTVWTQREHIQMGTDVNPKALLKKINVTIVNVLLELGSNGVKALSQFDPSLTISSVQTTICAPWSYTVTKTIHYNRDSSFVITKDLLSQLVETAKKQIQEELPNKKAIENLGLRIITDVTVQTKLNGYTINNPVGKKCKYVSLANISTVAREDILLVIEESLDKIFPKITVNHFSFMLIYYAVLEQLHPDTTEICLVDVTNEATEIGFVRKNVLTYTTNIPYGTFSLSREIAQACKIPSEEAYSILKDGLDNAKNVYGINKFTLINNIVDTYIDNLANQFSSTNDGLSISNTLFLHTSKNTEEFFANCLKKAAHKATNSQHVIHLCTSELLGENDIVDSSLILSAKYFHMTKGTVVHRSKGE